MNIQLNTVEDLIKFSHINKLLEVLKFAIRINLFDHIGETGQTIDHLSKKLSCNKSYFQHIVNALAALGLINQSNEYIFNSSIAKKYLSNEKRNNLSDLLFYGANSMLTEKNLMTKIIKKNVDVSVNEDALYMSAMERGNKYIALNIASKFIKKTDAVLLDLGCGSGIFSIMACRINKNLRAVCVDKEHILLGLREKLSQKKDLQHQISLMPGDILELKFKSNHYNYIIISNVLHFFDIETIKIIIAKCYDCLKTNGIIIINDIFVCHHNLYNILFSLEWLSNGISFITKEKMNKILIDGNFKNISDYQHEKYFTDLISATKF